MFVHHGRFRGALAIKMKYGHIIVSVFVHKKMKHWIAAVLEEKCARMHQILFQFPFFRG